MEIMARMMDDVNSFPRDMQNSRAEVWREVRFFCGWNLICRNLQHKKSSTHGGHEGVQYTH